VAQSISEARGESQSADRPQVAVFGPHPLLSVTIEARGEQGDDIHVHPGGQGVWVARMAAELGAKPILCGFVGGETGAILGGLLDDLGGRSELIPTAGSSGAHVVDRRSGELELISEARAAPPTRHELDDLFSATCEAALDSAVLVVCNPYPLDALPRELYRDLVSDVRAAGIPVMCDLSTPRLDRALEGEPDLVKLNVLELGEFASETMDTPAQIRGAAEQLHERGAGSVIVTRGGDAALALRGDEALEIVPPRFDHGWREGCGDAMLGAIAAGTARGLSWHESVVLGAAAGAANFLRRGLASASRDAVESLVERIELRAI
jgi:1-phosphofructokinase